MRKWLVPALVVAAVAAFVLWRFSAGTQAPTVVVYVSHDEVFSEPILKDFEKETGIKVRAVYDTEETKSTGVMNRLIAEKNNPAGGRVLGERAGASGGVAATGHRCALRLTKC
jgi:iron(III) transport system substrate-binding protein